MSDSTPRRNWLESLRRANLQLVGKLSVVAVLMFGFAYSLVPLYNAICSAL
eukprot:gene9023-11457_t